MTNSENRNNWIETELLDLESCVCPVSPNPPCVSVSVTVLNGKRRKPEHLVLSPDSVSDGSRAPFLTLSIFPSHSADRTIKGTFRIHVGTK